MQTTNLSSNRFLRKIPYFNCSIFSRGKKGEVYSIKLDIQPDYYINDIAYDFSESIDQELASYLEELPGLIKGKTAFTVLKLKSSRFKNKVPLISLPLLMLNQCINNFLGRDCGLNNYPGIGTDNLLCLCFGVYKEDMTSYFKSEENCSNEQDLDFYSSTMATLGCGSCKKEVQSELNNYIDHSILVEDQRIFYIQGKSPSEFLLVASDFIASWLNERILNEKSVRILELDKMDVICHFDLDDKNRYELQSSFYQKFKINLISRLLH